MGRVAEIFDEGFLLRLTEISQSKTWVKESFFDKNSVPRQIKTWWYYITYYSLIIVRNIGEETYTDSNPPLDC